MQEKLEPARIWTICAAMPDLIHGTKQSPKSAIWTNARRKRIRSVTVTVWLDGIPDCPDGLHVRGTVPQLIMRYLGKISYRKSGFPGPEGPGLCCASQEKQNRIYARLSDSWGAGSWAEDHLGGQSGGRMQLAVAGLGWPRLA